MGIINVFVGSGSDKGGSYFRCFSVIKELYWAIEFKYHLCREHFLDFGWCSFRNALGVGGPGCFCDVEVFFFHKMFNFWCLVLK